MLTLFWSAFQTKHEFSLSIGCASRMSKLPDHKDASCQDHECGSPQAPFDITPRGTFDDESLPCHLYMDMQVSLYSKWKMGRVEEHTWSHFSRVLFKRSTSFFCRSDMHRVCQNFSITKTRHVKATVMAPHRRRLTSRRVVHLAMNRSLVILTWICK